MPSPVSVGYQAHLDAGSCQLATLVEITRLVRGIRDPATAVRMTTYPVPIEFPVGSGTLYYPDDMVLISKIVETVGTNIDNAELTGILKTSRITSPAIRAGLFRGAEIRVSNVIWSNLGYGEQILKRCFLGDFTLQGDDSFDNQVLGLKSILSADVQQRYNATCPKVFGSPECGLDMTGRRHVVTVSAISGDGKMLTIARTDATGYYAMSPIIGESGDNKDLTQMVKGSTFTGGVNVLELVAPYPFPLVLGVDTFTVEEGDMHTWAACKAKGNFVNFGGYPHTPGNRSISQSGNPGGGKGK